MEMNEAGGHTYRQYTTYEIPRAVRWFVGIDEAGRGPLAGPVTVGAVMIPRVFVISGPSALGDSKQLSPKARDAWFSYLKGQERNGTIRVAVSSCAASVIDKKGIVPAVRLALARSLQKLGAAPEECLVLLDGSLTAPEQFRFQQTIIRGDESEPVISLASIVAKVTRDRHMQRMALRHPLYGFERHKGYGTLLHRTTIEAHGPCDIHRRSFI